MALLFRVVSPGWSEDPMVPFMSRCFFFSDLVNPSRNPAWCLQIFNCFHLLSKLRRLTLHLIIDTSNSALFLSHPRPSSGTSFRSSYTHFPVIWWSHLIRKQSCFRSCLISFLAAKGYYRCRFEFEEKFSFSMSEGLKMSIKITLRRKIFIHFLPWGSCGHLHWFKDIIFIFLSSHNRTIITVVIYFPLVKVPRLRQYSRNHLSHALAPSPIKTQSRPIFTLG